MPPLVCPLIRPMHLHCHREQSVQCAPLRPGCSVKTADFGMKLSKGPFFPSSINQVYLPYYPNNTISVIVCYSTDSWEGGTARTDWTIVSTSWWRHHCRGCR